MVSSRSFRNDHLIDRLAAGIAGAAGRISTDSLRSRPALFYPRSAPVAKQPENAVASSWRASVRPTFHSRYPQCSRQHGIFVCAWALPRVPEPRLPAQVLLSVRLPDLSVLWASGLAQVFSPVSNAAPNKLER
jgi:hypothetical protein